MPRGDRTGPRGAGPMTERGAGRCAGYNAPGFANRAAPQLGLRRGFAGGGRGWRHNYYATGLPGWMRFSAPPTSQQETDALKAQAEALKRELDAINKRIADLEGKP